MWRVARIAVLTRDKNGHSSLWNFLHRLRGHAIEFARWQNLQWGRGEIAAPATTCCYKLSWWVTSFHSS